MESLISSLGQSFLQFMPPETAHEMAINALSNGLGYVNKNPKKIPVTVGGLSLPNPMGLAAGFDKNARAPDALLGAGFGFVECGTVTPRPQAGNPKPRLFRLKEDMAIVNAMGFNNVGLSEFVNNLRNRSHLPGVVGANIGANKDSEDRIADYQEGVRRVWLHCSYITVNISSPNTKGLRNLQSGDALDELLGRINEVRDIQIRAHGHRPLFLKVAPDLDDSQIDNIAASIRAANIDALIVSNTTLDRPETLISKYKDRAGGLSGKPLFEKSTKVLSDFKSVLGDDIDLIGVGGISCGDDAIKKFEAGAKAIQVYSSLVYRGYRLIREIEDACSEYFGVK